MSRQRKIALGIATVLPAILYVFTFLGMFIFIFSSVMLALLQPEVSPSSPFGPIPVFVPIAIFAGMFLLQFFSMLWLWALLAIYIIDVFQNERVGKDTKALWAVVLFLGSIFAMAVYWYLYIWREPEESRQ